MKLKEVASLLVLFWLMVTNVFAQDPREKNHSIKTLPFIEDGTQKYYVTWSSSSGSDNGWQHDIYNQIISFTSGGELSFETDVHRYIGNGNDEAQEPVSVAINPNPNTILSVWEDGSGSTIDIRGQMHKPNGTIIKNNWIISGGVESQHSPDVVHLDGLFLVFLTDEAPPAQISMNEVRILNDETGEQIGSLELSHKEKDNWWVVSTSNNKNFAFVGWGNGEDFYGSIIKDDSISVTKTDPKFYIAHIDQYYYSVTWLEKLSKFIAVAKVNNKSVVCLIDTNGVRSNFTTIEDAPITRETELAVWWDNQNKEYNIAYTSGAKDLTFLKVSEMEISLGQINKNFITNRNWPTTGVSCKFVLSNAGKDFWNSNRKIFIVHNDENSNNPIYYFQTIKDLTDVTKINGTLIPEFHLSPTYPNPFNPTTTISFVVPNLETTRVLPILLKVYDSIGNEVATLLDENKKPGIYKVNFNGRHLSSGIYYYQLKSSNYFKTRKMILLK